LRCPGATPGNRINFVALLESVSPQISRKYSFTIVCHRDCRHILPPRIGYASAMVTRAQSWTLRIVVVLVTASFVGNGLHALMVWFRTQGS
jgi:hypothetical protein